MDRDRSSRVPPPAPVADGGTTSKSKPVRKAAAPPPDESKRKKPAARAAKVAAASTIAASAAPAPVDRDLDAAPLRGCGRLDQGGRDRQGRRGASQVRQAARQGRPADDGRLPAGPSERRRQRRRVARARSARPRRRGRDPGLLRGVPPGADARRPDRLDPAPDHRLGGRPGRPAGQRVRLAIRPSAPSQSGSNGSPARRGPSTAGRGPRGPAALSAPPGRSRHRRPAPRPRASPAGGRYACRSSCGTCPRGSPTT